MTGGQTALSLESTATAVDHRQRQAITAQRSRDTLDLVVIHASDDEIAAHEALLERLRAYGDCVWDRVEADSQAAK